MQHFIFDNSKTDIAENMLRITRLYTIIRLYTLMRLTIAGASVCSDETSDLFINEPTDIVVREGDNATLTCSISSYDTEDEHVEWEISPNIYETKESTVETPNIKTSEITVYSVGRTEQHFRCSIFFASRSALHETGRCHRSRVASTTVLYFPREDEISCGSNHATDSNPLRVGDVLQGRCEVSRGIPPVDIGWGTDDGDILIPQLGSFTEEGLMRVSVIKINSPEEFLNKSLVCIVTSKLAFPDRRLECRITPFIVQESPENTHSAGRFSKTVTEATSKRFHSTFDMFKPTATTSIISHTQSTTIIIGVFGSALLVCILLAIAYILNKCKNKNRSRTCHGQTTGLVQMARQANSATVLVEDHLYEDPDVDQDTTDNLDITHTYFVDTLPSPLSTSPDSCSTYFSEAFSSVYDDDEEEYYQPSTNLREITSCDSPCSSVYQNQHIVDIHSVSRKNARKGRPLYRRPHSDQPRGSHHPKEPKPPKLLVRAKPMKGSHLIEIGDVPSLGPPLLSGLSCHSPLSPSVSTALSPVTNPLSPSSVPISLSLSPTPCSSVSSSLPCHSKSSEPRSISLPTSPESSPRSQYICPAFSSLPSIYHTNTSRRPKSDVLMKENNLDEETSV